MELKFKGSELLANETLQDILVNITDKITFIKWHDNSITNGLGKDITLEYIDNQLCITEGLYSKSISKDMIIGVKVKDIAINSVFTSSEIASLYSKDEKAIRYYILNGQLEAGKDYRKAGRINLISLESMEKIYGPLAIVRLSSLAGVPHKFLCKEEIAELACNSRIEYDYNDCESKEGATGTCTVIIDKYALFIKATYTVINGNKAIAIDKDSVLEDYI